MILGSLAIVGQERLIRCTTPPLSLDRLNAAIAEPAKPFTQNEIASDRRPIDASTNGRVRDVLGQVVACSNAGEPLRVWSLYSPDYLGRLFLIQGAFDQVMYDAYAKPLPDKSGSGMQIVAIEEIWLSSTGAFGAEMVMRYPSVPMPKRLIFWFVRSGDDLQIEEIVGEISFSLP